MPESSRSRNGDLDPYTTLPQETSDYIHLRFQLARFRVHRVVRLPLTFTFANLHTLIQYMFGWNNSHIHKAEVFPNVVKYKDKKRPGTIKSCGRKRPLEDYELNDALAIDNWNRFERSDQPIYRVQKRVKNRKDEFDKIMLMEDKALALESIWTLDEANNVSDGECSNAEIGIIYTYDDGWNVHITCENDKMFHRVNPPSNIPIFKDAKGAPPIEDSEEEDPDELEADEKTVSPRLFDVSYFQGYCEGRISALTSETELQIFTMEEQQENLRKQVEVDEDDNEDEGDEEEYD